MKKKYLEANQKSWDKRTQVHEKSDFYDVAGFKKGKCSLMQLELNELGDVSNKKLIHLQCHFGQDTLSWARRGAQVTGIDFSPMAIATAQKLAEEIQCPARFICTDVYETLNALPESEQESFDIVFTSYGVIGWLPDLRPWAQVISKLLKPGGTFYIAEFHPFLWVLDDEFKAPHYAYQHNPDNPIIEENSGTYTDRNADIKSTEYNWNHSLSSVINALIAEGLELEFIHEHMSSPYDIFPRSIVIDDDPTLGQIGFQIAGLEDKIPMVFSLRAKKK